MKRWNQLFYVQRHLGWTVGKLCILASQTHEYSRSFFGRNECCVFWTKGEKKYPEISATPPKSSVCDGIKLYECCQQSMCSMAKYGINAEKDVEILDHHVLFQEDIFSSDFHVFSKTQSKTTVCTDYNWREEECMGSSIVWLQT